MGVKEVASNNTEQEFFVNETTYTPFIHQINAQPFVLATIEQYGLPQNTRLTEIPEEVWRRVRQETQADYIYFLGMYPESKIAKQIAKLYEQEHLTDMTGLTTENIRGSIFAVPSEDEFHPFVASSSEDYLSYKLRMEQLGLKIVLDEIPNHSAIDAKDQDLFLTLTQAEYESLPLGARHNFLYLEDEKKAIGLGKEMSPQEWIDTAQNAFYKKPVRNRLIDRMIGRMDKTHGYRADMAHLLTLDAFKRAWGWTGIQIEDETDLRDFWLHVSRELHSRNPSFLLIAEAYGKEYVDQLFSAFDGVYDKEYYDFLREVAGGKRHVSEVTYRLLAREIDPNRKQRIRFMQNHDEQPAVNVFGERASLAFGALQIFEPSGILLTQDAQMFGFRHKMPVQVNHYPREVIDGFTYGALSRLMRARKTNPIISQGDGFILQNYNPEFSGYINNSELVGFLYHNQDQGVAVCINLQNKNLDSWLALPSGAQVTSIESPIEGYYRRVDSENSNNILVSLVPYEVQLISYIVK